VILVVAATALEVEYLDGDVTLVCGIGPVESALATAAALAERRPRAVVHVGIAGATTLPPPTLVVGSEAVYCDVLDKASTFPRVDRIAADAGLLAAARAALPDARVLPIGTTGRVGGGADCEVEAMEGFGVLRAASLAGVAAVEVRAISNAVAERDRARWRVEDALGTLAAAVPPLLDALETFDA
jgi:nucleoside phosphorylase